MWRIYIQYTPPATGFKSTYNVYKVINFLYLENGMDEESNICEDTSEQSINGKNDDVEFSGENQNNQKETIEEKVNLPFRK